MSIWKFRLYLIPEHVSLPRSNATDNAGDYPWWTNTQPSVGFKSQIDSILPPMHSWSDGAQMWGAKQGGDITVWYVDETKSKVEQIEFRIDARAVSPDLIEKMCALARQLECVLITEDYRVVQPDEVDVMSAFNDSTAAKFMVDPVETLQGLKLPKSPN